MIQSFARFQGYDDRGWIVSKCNQNNVDSRGRHDVQGNQ